MCVVMASESIQMGKWKYQVLWVSKRQKLPNLFCQEGFVCNNPFEDQYYAGGSTSTEEGRMQTKYVCCRCSSDGKLATDACLDGKRKDTGGQETYSDLQSVHRCGAVGLEQEKENKQTPAHV